VRWPVFFAGLTVVGVVAGFSSLFVPEPAVLPLRMLAGSCAIPAALYGFWTKMMGKS
jgi:hypothetical protein